MATAFNAYAYSANPIPATTMPLNIGNVANFISQNQPAIANAGIDVIKCHQEGIARALAGSTQTRTWNLLIDVVAQTGHYTSTSTSASDFLVEGTKHYWDSVAIDRFTGKIISEQLEPVYQ